ncbi:DNA-binding protein [Paracidobacterium acidisoli]|uniref:DNA-binding protein n=1 Tax=Paracidobacterium acidisoli TaxID=2303751 RepID=UPI00207AC57B|nr:DNA-binding protein [Paracidobacterium acidisoli]
MREARLLLKAGESSGAYYLAGYALECGLKARIAGNIPRHTFPDRKLANDAYTHDLTRLIKLANLSDILSERAGKDPVFQQNWLLATRWSEASRYSIYTEQDCRDFLNAIAEKRHGVMSWVKQHW